MSNTIKYVVDNVLGNLYNHAWNPKAAFKNHNQSWTLNAGGLYINYMDNINWAAYDPNIDVNENSADQTATNQGLTQLTNHDHQVCLQYLHAVSNYIQAYPTDTRFTYANGSGYLSVSAMVDHVYNDFIPYYSSTQYGSYNNPKGWVYFALRDTWLNLKDTGLITPTQANNLFQATLYAVFTYMNSWWDSGISIFDNEIHANYQPSQSLLMAAAVLDAAQRFPASIASGMFYDPAPYSPQTAAGWTSAANTAIGNILNRGAFSSSYGLHYGYMNVVTGQSTDTVKASVVKSDDVSETAEALVLLYSLTGTTSYLTQAQSLLNQIDQYFLDTNNGGYYASMDLNTGVVVTAYKECRATAHMLIAYHVFNLINPIYSQREQSIVYTLLNQMYKTVGDTGYYYRVKGDATFGVYSDHYVPSWSSTVSSSVNAGDTSVQVSSWPKSNTTTCSQSISPGSNTITPVLMKNITVGDHLLINGGTGTQENVTVTAIGLDGQGNQINFTAVFAYAHSGTWTINITFPDTCIILNYGGASEEEVVLKLQNTTGNSAPFTAPLNALYNGNGQFINAHAAGEPIQTMLSPMTLVENQYTTEAMGNLTGYLLNTVLTPISPLTPNTVLGIDGFDTLLGVDGYATFFGCDGVDSFPGVDGADTFSGVDGVDLAYGVDGFDTLTGDG